MDAVTMTAGVGQGATLPPGAPGTNGGTTLHVQAGAGWWAGWIGSAAASRPDREGIALILPPGGAGCVIAAGGPPGSDPWTELSALAGSGGLVWLDPSARQWHLLAPQDGGALILSRSRLPPRWPLSSSARQRSGAAKPGDLLVLWNGAGEPELEPGRDGTWALARLIGGGFAARGAVVLAVLD